MRQEKPISVTFETDRQRAVRLKQEREQEEQKKREEEEKERLEEKRCRTELRKKQKHHENVSLEEGGKEEAKSAGKRSTKMKTSTKRAASCDKKVSTEKDGIDVSSDDDSDNGGGCGF